MHKHTVTVTQTVTVNSNLLPSQLPAQAQGQYAIVAIKINNNYYESVCTIS